MGFILKGFHRSDKDGHYLQIKASRMSRPWVGDAFTNQKKEFGVILQFKKNLTEFE